MAKSIESLVSFSGGEWSPLLTSRVDQQKYKSACRQLRNMVALKTGGATRRPGTQFIAKTKFSGGVGEFPITRLLPFQFSNRTAFVLEMGDQYIRFFSNGAQVMSGGVPYEIASPYTAVYSHANLCEVFQISWVEINDLIYFAHPSHPVYKLSRIADTNWTLAPVVFDVPPLLDQNTSGIYIGASATTGSVTLSANADAWAGGAFYDVQDSVSHSGALYTCLVGHVSGTFATDLAAGNWVAVTVFQSGHVGSYWQLAQTRVNAYVSYDLTGNGDSGTLEILGDWEVRTYGVWKADIAVLRSDDGGTTWIPVRNIFGGERNVDLPGTAVTQGLYKLTITNWAAPTAAGVTTPRVVLEAIDTFIYGEVKITAVANAYAATALVIKKLSSTNTTRFWSEGAWSAVRGYPKAVAAFQQRLWYGFSTYEPQRLWGSVISDIENFNRGDSSKATDSVAFDLAATGRGAGQWILGQTSLFAGLEEAEWVIESADQTSAISATNIRASEQSNYGSSANIPAVVLGDATIFVPKQGLSVRQMLFAITTNKFMSQDLTALAGHVAARGIIQMDYQKRFYDESILWIVTGDGRMSGMTYELDQQVFGWHRHDTGRDIDDTKLLVGGFGSLAVLRAKEDNYAAPMFNGVMNDEVWVVAHRIVGGLSVSYVERMWPYVWQVGSFAPVGNPLPQYSFYVDSGVQTVSPATNVISGLSHLVGRTVVASVQNQTSEVMVVANDGTVTIPNYNPTAGDVVTVGLPINYAVQPMSLDVDSHTGVTQAITKALSHVYLRLYQSSGGQVSNGVDTFDIVYRTPTDTLGTEVALGTGEREIPLPSDYGTDVSIIVQGSDALPMTLLAIIAKYNLSGTP